MFEFLILRFRANGLIQTPHNRVAARPISDREEGKLISVFYVACLFALVPLTATAAEARPLEVADWLDWERAADAQIAPDGKRIVYTRQRVDKMRDRWTSELWIIDADGSRHRYLADGSDALWSPSGDKIAYLHTEDNGEKVGIFVRLMDEEGASRNVTFKLDSPSRLAWSPDGNHLAVRARVPMEPLWQLDLPGKPTGAEWTKDAVVTDRLHYRQDGVGRKDWYNHIFLVPIDGGVPRQLTSGTWDVGARKEGGGTDSGGRLRFTSDGAHILFDGVRSERGEEAEAFVSHLYAVSVAHGDIRQITSDQGFWHHPVPSPDGKLVAYAGHEPSKSNYKVPQLRVTKFDGSDQRVLVDALPAGNSSISWASSISWDQKGEGVYYTVDLQGDTNLHYISLDGGKRLVTQGTHRLSFDSLSGVGVGAGIITAPKITRNLVRFDLADSGDIATLTDLNADVFANVNLGDVEEFWAESTDETRVQGWIIDPPNYDPNESYPLLLAIHGGPDGMYGTDFQPMFQFFAAMGYVVVYANPRGSTGYSSEFANAIDNRYPGRRDFDDLMAATDATIERRSIDTDRLFVQGCSGGGVLTAWIVGHTDRFAAAAARCSVVNFISFAGTTDIVAWGHERFRPPFWEEPERWLTHSPLMYVGNVKTPTLLMTGEKDLNTPLSQAEEFYSALKRLKVRTALIEMKGEWHGTTRRPSNMLRTVLYMDEWFSQHAN